jgi:hypothetical protein
MSKKEIDWDSESKRLLLKEENLHEYILGLIQIQTETLVWRLCLSVFLSEDQSSSLCRNPFHQISLNETMFHFTNNQNINCFIQW